MIIAAGCGFNRRWENSYEKSSAPRRKQKVKNLGFEIAPNLNNEKRSVE